MMEVNWRSLIEGGQKRVLLYIAGGIAGVLMVFVILCNLLLIVSNVKEPNQMPEVLGIRPAIVLSGSMEPAFYPGDVILLKKTEEPEKLEVGDVACYLYSGKATTHRITERFEADGKTRYIMKGDYNNVEDRLAVDPEQIQGVWTGGRIPHLGRLLMFLQSTMGMFLFLICPLAGVLSWDILKRKREERLRHEAWEQGECAAYEEPENGSVLGRELRRISGLRRKQTDDRTAGTENDEKYRRLEEELEAYRRREESRSGREEARDQEAWEEAESRRRLADARAREAWTDSESPRRPEVSESRRRLEAAKSRRGSEETQYRQNRGSTARQYWSDGGFPGELDEEFAYYAGQDESLDYLEELEEAALHYRKMKESLARYRRMEAVMTRCRRLEEDLARYEALAERLDHYERQRGRSRPDDTGRDRTSRALPGNSSHEGAGKAAETKSGVSNQGSESETSVDHIDRPSRSEKPE